MTWTVSVSRTASRAIKKAPKGDQARIRTALLQLRDDPYSGDIKSLKGYADKTVRRRVGDWRIIFTVDDEVLRVEVVEIARRSSTTYA